MQEPYSLLKPVLFSVYQKFGIPTVNTGPEIGSVELIEAVLTKAGFNVVEVCYLSVDIVSLSILLISCLKTLCLSRAILAAAIPICCRRFATRAC